MCSYKRQSLVWRLPSNNPTFMSALKDPQLFLTALTIFPQLLLFGTDTLGGVSGQDSIIRSTIAALDISAGLIYLNGVYEFVFTPAKDSYLHIPRWGKLHSAEYNATSNKMQITTRTRWLPVFALSQRSARLLSGVCHSMRQQIHH